MKNIVDFLFERGFIEQISSKDLKNSKNLKMYLGFDPTADSLHLGNLMGIIVLKWFEKFGFETYALVGGATGRIGDPSGKSIERPLLEDAIIDQNVRKIKELLKKLLGDKVRVVDNNDWYKEISFINFLRDVGKHFRLSVMLARESVKLRLNSEEGMSFTEFSYQMLQGYDFYYLYKHYGINLEMGGSDQWGNICSGIEFVRKMTTEAVYGMTFPLLVRSDGKKFGKSEEGAIWLSPEKLSFYQFYQYLLQIPDADVIRMMKLLTFLDLKEIMDIEKSMQDKNYVSNSAQRKLAEEVTLFVHGKEGLEIALKVTKGAAPGAKMEITEDIIKEIAKDMPNVNLKLEEIVNQKFADVALKAGVVSSKSEAVRLVKNGGGYLNEEKIEDPHYTIQQGDLVGHKYLIIGSGKKKKTLVIVI